MLDLDRTHVELTLVPEYVQQELGGLRDRIQRERRMVIPIDAEVRDGLQIVEPRTGEQKEVAQHLIRQPDGGQVRQAVEDVNGMLARILDDLVDVGDEALEAQRGVRRVDLGAEVVGNQLLVGCKPEVDQPPVRCQGGLGIGRDQGLVVRHPVHLPDDVVARHDAPEHLVQSRKTGRKSRGHDGLRVLKEIAVFWSPR